LHLQSELVAVKGELARLNALYVLVKDSAQAELVIDSLQLQTILALAAEQIMQQPTELIQMEATPDQWLMLDSLQFLGEHIHRFFGIAGQRAAFQLARFDNTFDVLILNLKSAGNLDLFLKARTGKNYYDFKTLRELMHKEGQRLVFATNAGMFSPSYQPQGLYVEDGRLIKPLDTIQEGYGNFYLQPNGVFCMDSNGTAHVAPTATFAQALDTVQFATQSGPMLVIDSAIHPAFTEGSHNKYIRSGVGVLNPHTLVFAISNQPVNFFDFGSLFKDYFGCRNALYLDGAISKMYLPEIGRFELDGQFGPMIGLVEAIR
ncbi:MAG: phosphodiester glycosidase family protein, partial [Phaeodactylibacter sp.]|nr:phosphodiester glycosidase family protein [Phaeodactylibacter sp.]